MKASKAYAERGGDVEATISGKKRLTGPATGDPHPKHGSWLHIAEIELSVLT